MRKIFTKRAPQAELASQDANMAEGQPEQQQEIVFQTFNPAFSQRSTASGRPTARASDDDPAEYPTMMDDHQKIQMAV